MTIGIYKIFFSSILTPWLLVCIFFVSNGLGAIGENSYISEALLFRGYGVTKSFISTSPVNNSLYFLHLLLKDSKTYLQCVSKKNHVTVPPLSNSKYYDHLDSTSFQWIENGKYVDSRWGVVDPFDLTMPVDWGFEGYNNTTWQLYLNMPQFIDFFIADFKLNNNVDSMLTSVDYMVDWHSYNVKESRRNAFKWEEHAVSQRIRKIAVLLNWCDVSGLCEEYDVEVLEELLCRHIHKIKSYSYSYGNHSIMRYLGLAEAVYIYPYVNNKDSLQTLAESALHKLYDFEFGTEHILLEGASIYHLFVANLFSSIIDNPAFPVAFRNFFQDQLEEVFANDKYLFFPNKELIVIGDSELISRDYEVVQGDHLFSESGFNFLAGNRNDAQNPELFFKTAYKAGAMHEHHDVFHVSWYDNGKRILTDNGLFSYDSIPMNVYMRSSKAHNTVVINNNNEYGGDTFDSAVVPSEYFIMDSVSFISAAHTFSGLGVNFKRNILFNKGNYLLVVDEMTPEQNETFHYSQLFHFAPGWEPMDNAGAFVMKNGTSSVEITSISGIQPQVYYGQVDPYIQGFVAYQRHEAVPVSVLSYDVAGTGRVIIATLFELGSATERLTDSQACVNYIVSGNAQMCLAN